MIFDYPRKFSWPLLNSLTIVQIQTQQGESIGALIFERISDMWSGDYLFS